MAINGVEKGTASIAQAEKVGVLSRTPLNKTINRVTSFIDAVSGGVRVSVPHALLSGVQIGSMVFRISLIHIEVHPATGGKAAQSSGEINEADNLEELYKEPNLFQRNRLLKTALSKNGQKHP